MRTGMKQITKLVLPLLLIPLRLVCFSFAAPTLLLAILLLYVIDDTAITHNNQTLSNSDIHRAKEIVANSTLKTHNTRHLNEKEISLALSYLLNKYIRSTSKITISKDLLHFKISLLLNNNDFGKYLNLSFKLTKQQDYPAINSLQIGKIKIADEFARVILENIINYTPLKDFYILASQHIKDIQINTTGLTISYNSSAALNSQKKLSLNNTNYQPVIFYQQHITKIISQHDPKWRLSLAELMQPLFKLAYHRSTFANAIAENRAVLIAISTYVNKNEIQAFLPIDISPTTLRQYPASLYQRTDMAKHFIASAALAATGAGTLAQIIGQEKELIDAKQGSGFSFIDLAGDRAGLRFGKTAVKSEKKARKLQKRMANIKHYTAFMPEVRDLPENMNDMAFKQTYRSIYSSKYQRMLKKIDRRISDLAIYQ
jgi:hypothetical protein